MEKKSKKTGKISRKIIRNIIVINVIALLILGVSVGVVVNARVGNLSNEYTIGQIMSNKNYVEQGFLSIESAVKSVAVEFAEATDVAKAKSDPQYLKDLQASKRALIKKLGEELGITRSIYVYYNVAMFKQEIDIWYFDNADGNGFQLQDPFGMAYYSDYNAWYNLPIDDGVSTWTFPYISETGTAISSYITPIVKDGVNIGLVGMDLYMSDIQETLNNIKLFDSGYLYLMDNEGNLITHPSIEWKEDGTPANINDHGDYTAMLTRMNNEPRGIFDYNAGDGKNIITYDHLDNGWILVATIPVGEVNSVINLITLIMIVVLILAIVVSVIVAFFIGRSISKPIIDVVAATDKISHGDFTVNVETTNNDETKLLADGLNLMVNSVQYLISEVRTVASEMLLEANNLAAMSEETNAATNQVALAINEISIGAQGAAQESEAGAKIANLINEKVTLMKEKSTTMQSSANDAIKMNKAGIEALKVLKDTSSIAENSNLKVEKAIESLESRVKDITAIISTIASIANQTNLLALNASIEAARAGEAGKGFAVVAEEIRKLAEDSGQATKEISDIMKAIQADSAETVVVMGELKEVSLDQHNAVVNVNESFDVIFKSVDKITKEIEMITSELIELNHSKDELVTVTSNISAVSEETAASTEQVNASMTEQSKAVEEVARSAEKLNGLSVELDKQISVFKI